MEDSELLKLLNDLESDHVERKAAFSESDRICEAICAFANDLPNHRRAGVIFIGIQDNGSCANYHITDELLLKLADLRSNGNILPFPAMTVQKKTLNGCECAVVVVHPSDDPPVRFRGRTWIRVGPRRAIATPEEERRLSEKRRSRNLPFDIQPAFTANLDDLDIDLFKRVYLPSALPADILAENHRTTTQQLSSLRFVSPESEVDAKPTMLGILTIGKDARQFLPEAYIQFLRVDGTTLTDPIKDQKEIYGPIPDMFRVLDETFQAHISIATDITSAPVEIRHPDYPIVALQQLARNAILHRTYEGTNAPVRIYWFSDRIEIHNPGGPYGQVNLNNFGVPGITDYRNPHLAEVMKNLGYIQRFGVGIPLARQELQKNGNPALLLEPRDSFVLVTMRR